MSASAAAIASGQGSGWVEWLRRELAPFPGRAAMTLRLVVAVVLVTIIGMALQVPFLAFSGFFVFFVTKDNAVLTMRTGIVFILCVTVASVICLVLSQFTFDHPELRIPVMAGMVFAGMFLSRASVIGPVGFAIGFITALILTLTENIPNTDELVRTQLWLWMAIVYPIVLTVVINRILLPGDPWTMFLQTLIGRLDTPASVLERIIKDGAAGGQDNQALLEAATRGSSRLFALLTLVEAKDLELKRHHRSFVATIAASEHLVTAAASLGFREPHPLSENDLLCAKALLAELEQLRAATQWRKPDLSPRDPDAPAATLPQLRDLQFAVGSFRDSLIVENPTETVSTAKPAKKSFFVSDAFTNPAHAWFALKVTLAGMCCYLIYTGLNWPGIETSFITCCFISLENTGATVRKASLRLTGCALGGLSAFLSIVFLIPQMESITSLVLLIAVASALAGWVAAGSDRISYAGLQAAFAFYLGVFQGYAPDINFDTIRDRVVGIALGIAVTSVVFEYIWPERAVDRLRATLARVLRNLSQLLVIPSLGASVQADKETAEAMHGAITKDLDTTLRLSELTVFESVKAGEPDGLSPSAFERLVPQTEILCLVTIALLSKTKLEEWQRLEEPAQQAEAVLRINAAEQLQHVSAFIETGQPSTPVNLDSSFATWNHTVAEVAENDRPRLVRRLVEQIRQLRSR